MLSDMNFGPSWPTAIAISAALMAVAGVLICATIIHIRRRRRNAATTTTGDGGDTPPTTAAKKEGGCWGWWSLCKAMIALVIIAWVAIAIIKACRQSPSSAKTQGVETTQSKLLPLPPGGGEPITINDREWTALPKAKSGKPHFALKFSAVRVLTRCTNLLSDGTPQVVKIVEFGGKAGDFADLPPCEEYEMKTVNAKETIVFFWE